LGERNFARVNIQQKPLQALNQLITFSNIAPLSCQGEIVFSNLGIGCGLGPRFSLPGSGKAVANMIT
jgi:hypothetical protein